MLPFSVRPACSLSSPSHAAHGPLPLPKGRGKERPLARSRPMPSSVIRSFDYDPAAHRLAVTFVSGKRYAYLGVPEAVADHFRRAFSKGEYFNAAIRDLYPFERLR